MKRKNLISKTAICLYLVLVAVLTSCDDPRQYVYEAEGLIIKSIMLTEKEKKQERGKYTYMAKDLTGEVKIWSNTKFEIGDTIKFTTHCH